MQNKPSNDPDYDLSESIKKENKNITCKDGYCFIPNLKENKTINNENVNIFDPIQILFRIKELCLANLKKHLISINKKTIKLIHTRDKL